MILKRPELCRLIGFCSWTAVQAWLLEVIEAPFFHLIEGYLAPYRQHGQKSPTGSEGIKDYFVHRAPILETLVEQRFAELEYDFQSIALPESVTSTCKSLMLCLRRVQ